MGGEQCPLGVRKIRNKGICKGLGFVSTKTTTTLPPLEPRQPPHSSICIYPGAPCVLHGATRLLPCSVHTPPLFLALPICLPTRPTALSSVANTSMRASTASLSQFSRFCAYGIFPSFEAFITAHLACVCAHAQVPQPRDSNQNVGAAHGSRSCY